MKFFFLTVLLGIAVVTTSANTLAAPEIIAEQCSSGNCTPLEQTQTEQVVSGDFVVGSTITLQITAKNPERLPIYSTQSWLSYNPSIFEVTAVDGSKSDFSLAAPGEMQADDQAKIIKIGRAVTGLPVTAPKATIAQITIKVLQDPSNTQLSFYNFRSNDVGKTSLLSLQNFLPENILKTAPKNIVFKKSETNTQLTTTPLHSAPTQTNTTYGVENTHTPNSTPQPTPIQPSINIPRPKGLRSRTYADGGTEHLWKLGEDSRIKGYYLYYSTSSGRYMHRRDVGRTNTYRFAPDTFEKGKRVYFAVQAYNTAGKTSDFSDETYVVVGHAGSESHPFFEQIFPNVDPQNAVIVKGSNGKVIYKGTRKQNYKADVAAGKKFPTPQQNVQSGMAGNLFFILGGILLLGGFAFLRRPPLEKKIFSKNFAVRWA